MIIEIDHLIGNDGIRNGRMIVDTSTAQVQATLTALKGNAAAQQQAGYSDISRHTAYPGMTRWQVLQAELLRLNDPIGRGILGI